MEGAETTGRDNNGNASQGKWCLSWPLKDGAGGWCRGLEKTVPTKAVDTAKDRRQVILAESEVGEERLRAGAV